MNPIDIIVIALYFIGLASILYFTRRAKSLEDFAVGSKKIPKEVIFASLAATAIGPGYSLGLIENSVNEGFIWFYIFLGFSLQSFLIGRFVAPRLNSYRGAFTIGDIMELKYGKFFKVIAGILSVALCVGVIGAISKASGDLISNLFDISFVNAVILSNGIVILYSTYGGIKSVLATDVIQFVILGIGIPLLLLITVNSNAGAAVLESISFVDVSSKSDYSGLELLGLFVGFLLGETLAPPYTNRALIAKDKDHARKGFIWTAIFSVAWFFICSTIGGVGSNLFPESSNVLLDLVDRFLPIGLTGIILAGIISIIMSTQDSLLNSASVALNIDILKPMLNIEYSAKNSLYATQILNLVIGILATIFALNVFSVVQALLICYTLWAPTIVLPFIIGILLEKTYKEAVFVSILFGGVAALLCEFAFEVAVPTILVGVLVNQLGYWVTHFLMTKKNQNV